LKTGGGKTTAKNTDKFNKIIMEEKCDKVR
jgi:hypothetical protein